VNHGQTYDQGEIFSHLFAGASNTFQHKAHTVLKTTPIFVGALIPGWRKKLIDQISERMNVDDVKPSLFG
jgi:hypothetical protein